MEKIWHDEAWEDYLYWQLEQELQSEKKKDYIREEE